MKTLQVLGITALVALSGCAHVPDAKVNYYLARTKVTFKVVRTVACDAQNQPVVSNAVTPTVVHTADPTNSQVLELTRLRGQLSDNDMKFELYEDGRLKAVNATSTGQGEGIFKTVVSIAAAVFALDGSSPKFPEQCATIKKAGEGKPLTLS